MNLKAAINVINYAEVSQTINLRNNNIGPQEAKYLFEQLKHAQVSHFIHLRDNNIGAQGAKDVAEQLKDAQVSHNIGLSGNNIGDQGAKYVAEQLKDAQVSHRILLEENNIGDQGAKDVAEQLKDAQVSHTIHLRDNNIGDQGAKDVAEQLKDAQVSHTIGLSGNNIGAQGAKDVAEQLKDSQVSHTINLSSNYISDEGAKYVAEQLKDAKVSQTIDLGYNKIGAQGAKYVAEQLKDAKVSQTIDLSFNEIGAQGAKYVAEQLKDSQVSHTINLSSNYISDEGAKYVAEQLKDAQVSHTINLSSNYISDEGAKDLFEQLKDAKVSHTIHLGYNKIGDQGIKTLKKLYNAPIPPRIKEMEEFDDLNKNNELKQKVFQSFNPEIYKLFADSFDTEFYHSIYKTKTNESGEFIQNSNIPVLALNGKKDLFANKGINVGINVLDIVGEFLGEKEIYRMNVELIKALQLHKNNDFDTNFKKLLEIHKNKPGTFNALTSYNARKAFKAGVKFSELETVAGNPTKFKALTSHKAIEAYKAGVKFTELSEIYHDGRNLDKFKVLTSHKAIEAYKAGVKFTELSEIYHDGRNLDKFKVLTSNEAIQQYHAGVKFEFYKNEYLALDKYIIADHAPILSIQNNFGNPSDSNNIFIAFTIRTAIENKSTIDYFVPDAVKQNALTETISSYMPEDSSSVDFMWIGTHVIANIALASSMSYPSFVAKAKGVFVNSSLFAGQLYVQHNINDYYAAADKEGTSISYYAYAGVVVVAQMGLAASAMRASNPVVSKYMIGYAAASAGFSSSTKILMIQNQEAYKDASQSWIPSVISTAVAIGGIIVTKNEYLPGSEVSKMHMVTKGFVLMNAVSLANEMTKAGILLMSKTYDYFSGNNEQSNEQNIDHSPDYNISVIDLQNQDELPAGGDL
jgi:Ran GTPase-activating protein (RanGAP) involved in mRNA processing and transport